MKDFNLCFSWVINTADIIDLIQEKNHIEVNGENYENIFENLSDYLKIDDVVFNTSKHPFLFNFVQGSLQHPEKDLKTIFTEILSKADLEKFGINSENFCQTKEKIHQGFKRLFQDSEKQINDLLGQKFENFRGNLHFVDYQDLVKSSYKTFEKFNQNESNFEELKEKFLKRIENFICENSYNLSFKLDSLKPLVGLESEKIHDNQSFIDQHKNILHIDYDCPEFFNFEIDDQTSMFPKFALINPYVALGGEPSYFPRLTGAMIYFPSLCEKLLCMFFDHSLETDEQYHNLIHPEMKFEILFEYLTSKNLKTNDEMKKFLETKTYQELYRDYDQFYQEWLSQSKAYQIILRFIDYHFDFKNFDVNKIINDYNSGSVESIDLTNPMHFLNKNGQIITSGMINSGLINNESQIPTWVMPAKEVEKLSQKNDIFEQIRTGLGFL